MSKNEKSKVWLTQQGDVYWVKVDELPAGLKPVKSKFPGRVVFAEGESHGHAHAVLESSGTELFEDAKGTLWCSVPTDTVVKHEEHGPVNLPAGKYKVGIVREYDPFAEEIRKVRD